MTHEIRLDADDIRAAVTEYVAARLKTNPLLVKVKIHADHQPADRPYESDQTTVYAVAEVRQPEDER